MGEVNMSSSKSEVSLEEALEITIKMFQELKKENEKLRDCVEFCIRETVAHHCDKEYMRKTLEEINSINSSNSKDK